MFKIIGTKSQACFYCDKYKLVNDILESNKIKSIYINPVNNKEVEEEKENITVLEKDFDIDIIKQDYDEDIIEEDLMFKSIIEDLNKNIFINVKKQEEEKNELACKELLKIIKF